MTDVKITGFAPGIVAESPQPRVKQSGNSRRGLGAESPALPLACVTESGRGRPNTCTEFTYTFK